MLRMSAGYVLLQGPKNRRTLIVGFGLNRFESTGREQ